jgi:hypothetical protein
MMVEVPCACCGYYTISGDYEICDICWWESDLVQEAHPDSTSGANRTSLRQAQRNFAAFGAMSADFKDDARKPTASDRRNPDWKPLDEGGKQDVIAQDIIAGRRRWGGGPGESS